MPKIARSAVKTAPSRKAPKASAKTALVASPEKRVEKSAPSKPEKTKSSSSGLKVAAKAAAPVAKAPIAPEIVRGSMRRDETPRRLERDDVPCRSCGIRPGRPTAIIGQLTATELCEVCATLRKERIRQNRASQRGYRL